jgi:hypothetical protein
MEWASIDLAFLIKMGKEPSVIDILMQNQSTNN